jgi:hypothetical protein
MTMTACGGTFMKILKRLALVFGGYALALAASIASVALYDLRFSAADNQAMGGMIAGGEMILGCGVFVVASLVPTGLALWYLRESRGFWSAFSIVGLVFAIAGLAWALLALAPSRLMASLPALQFAEILSPLRMLSAPLWLGGFLLFALLAPARDLRQRMLVAAAIELAIVVCGVLYYLRTAPPL